MTKADLAGYLASISSIMDSIDDSGSTLRPQWLKDEYERTWEALKQEVRNDEEKRRNAEKHHDNVGRQANASDQPRGGVENGHHGGNNNET